MMGRGNVCVTGPYEGLYYIDNDYLHVYVRDSEEDDESIESQLMGDLDYGELTSGGWEYDDFLSRIVWEDTVRHLQNRLIKKYPSFWKSKEWVTRDAQAILENNLFYVAVEDNQWSIAVKLLQKEDPYRTLDGPQRRHYQSYLNGIRDVLFELFPKLGVYGGPWTSGFIEREEEAG